MCAMRNLILEAQRFQLGQIYALQLGGWHLHAPVAVRGVVDEVGAHAVAVTRDSVEGARFLVVLELA